MKDLSERMLQAIRTLTVNDISYDVMNRVARRISHLTPRERGAAVRVGEIISEELGPEKAREYVEKAFANGLISSREYEELRAAIVLALPRERLPLPSVAPLARELVGSQERLRREFDALSETGRQVFARPMRSLDEDVRRLRRAWRI